MGKQYGAPDPVGPTKPSAGYGGSVDSTRRDSGPTVKGDDPAPPTAAVTMFHRNASVDTRLEDIHHTLGGNPTQAASGSHTHNGSDSPLLLDAYIISGSKANPSTVLPSIIEALKHLGAKDSTT